MKFMIETGKEQHTTSFQSMQAKFVGGPTDGQFLYTATRQAVSSEWLENSKHITVVKTVYELPGGTELLIDYKGHNGNEKFVVRLDSAQEVQELEVGTSKLRTYTVKGRFVIVRDLLKEASAARTASQNDGF